MFYVDPLQQPIDIHSVILTMMWAGTPESCPPATCDSEPGRGRGREIRHEDPPERRNKSRDVEMLVGTATCFSVRGLWRHSNLQQFESCEILKNPFRQRGKGAIPQIPVDGERTRRSGERQRA